MSLAVYTTALLNHRPIANEVPVIILDGENSSLGIGVGSLPATHPEKVEVRRIARSQPYGCKARLSSGTALSIREL